MDDSVNLLDGLDLDLDVPSDPRETPGRSAPREERPLEFFGPYQLIQQVGVGGVARVMRARHIHPRYADETFAIKILHEDLSRDPQVVTLFRHEAYVLSQLQHPNVVQTFEAGVQDEKLFIAMEYIDGRDLDNMMARCKAHDIAIPIPLAMHLVGETLNGLCYAHELCDADGNRLNLVHRDINPANVFLSYDGRVKLGDFGVASIAAGLLERSREVAGKAGYFAPEQLEGAEVDQRADVFSVGVMIFELLCGNKLFEADSTDKVLRLNKRAKIPRPSKVNPDISPELEEIMLWALERRPDERIGSAREMLAALGRFIPVRSGMSLAVAALMRKAFLGEHIQELQLREGLAGIGPERGSGQLVAVCSSDERAQGAFNELLLSRGYRVETHASCATLCDSLAGASPPETVLLDVGIADFSAATVRGVVPVAREATPVIAVSDDLAVDSVKRAYDVGAVSLLFRPFNIEGVLTAVRAAITRTAHVNHGDSKAGESRTYIRLRLLLLSQDLDLITRLTRGLPAQAFDVEVASTAQEALRRADDASYHVILYDAPTPTPADRYFAGQYRARIGMGLVPVIYLTPASGAPVFDGVDADRSSVCDRGAPPMQIGELVQRLHLDTRVGRTFVRYGVRFAVEMRYGGRVFAGEASDLSRGGVMLRSDQMPPVGTEVGVSMRLAGLSSPIEVSGRVVRVDLPGPHDGDRAGIGVEFERFSGRGEGDLIGYIVALEQPTPRRPTVILGAPPPARA